MLKFSNSAIDWAARKLSELRQKPGFPQDEIPFLANAGALLRIAHPIIVRNRLEHARRTGQRYESYVPTPEDQAATGEELQAVKVSAWHKEMVFDQQTQKTKDQWTEVPGSAANPVDYLIDTALDTFKFFPQPIEIRALAWFPVADGKDYELPEKSEAAG